MIEGDFLDSRDDASVSLIIDGVPTATEHIALSTLDVNRRLGKNVITEQRRHWANGGWQVTDSAVIVNALVTDKYGYIVSKQIGEEISVDALRKTNYLLKDDWPSYQPNTIFVSNDVVKTED